jgi:choline dehydrogenase
MSTHFDTTLSVPDRPAPFWRPGSEDDSKKILLIEAGPDYPDEDAIPDDVRESRGLGGPNHDWRYTVTPIAGRTLGFLRGKVIGGTSAVKACAAQRGDPRDFDEWTKLGLEG